MSRGPRPPGASLVLTCGDAAGWTARAGEAGDEVVDVGELPDRAEVDPLLDRAARLVVAGTDAALAAVLVRLLRRERLDLPVALLPAPGSPAARTWGVPTVPDRALALARTGTPTPAALIRDDRGRVLVGVHRVGGFVGEVYCDEHLVARGATAGLEVRPDPAGHGVVATAVGARRLAGLRPGTRTERRGRAVQIGCHPAPVERDGVADDRPVERCSWYPHTTDWLAVLPGPPGPGRPVSAGGPGRVGGAG